MWEDPDVTLLVGLHVEVPLEGHELRPYRHEER